MNRARHPAGARWPAAARPVHGVVAVLSVLTVLTVLGGIVLRPSPVAAAPTSAPVLPCPTVRVKPVPAPKPSPLPTHDVDAAVVGGDGLATTGLAVPAGAPPLPGTISATSWVVADLDTGAVLGACAPHAYGAPASLQKLLLAAAVMPKLTPTEVTTVTAEDLAFEPGSSAVGLLLGGHYSVETLWLGLMLNSGNDAANVLARLGGDGRGVAGAVASMNTTAHDLGALDTKADTPSGLDGPGQVTSAYDLALISRADFRLADFRRYTAARTATIPPQPPVDRRGYQIQNDNQLLFHYPGAIGGKTGFTDIARHTYMGAAEREGRRLVVTMLGGEHQPVRLWMQGAALLDWGFAVAGGSSVGQLVEPGSVADQTALASGRRPAPQASLPRLAVAASVAAGPPSPTLIGSVSAVAAVFAAAWVVILRAGRRRRGRHGARPGAPTTPSASRD